jgi:hypothetical protein
MYVYFFNNNLYFEMIFTNKSLKTAVNENGYKMK